MPILYLINAEQFFMAPFVQADGVMIVRYVLEHMFFHSPLLAIYGSGAGKNEITFAQVHMCSL